jgi:hypothetical protein
VKILAGIFLSRFFLLHFNLPSFSAIWDSGGSNNLVLNLANWTENVLPPCGDDIVFNATSSKYCKCKSAEVNKEN